MASSTFKPDGAVRKLSQTISDFSLDMYRHLPGFEQGDNLFFSPFSIASVLSMVYMGAKGNTAKEMKDVLKIIPMKDILHTAYRDYIEVLQSKNINFTLSTANRVYSQLGGNISDSFKFNCTEYYDAPPIAVDFVTQAEAIRQQINTWVERQTNNKIRDLIAEGVLNAMTRMVIVNAIYFKGDWACQFNPETTKKKPFHITQTKTVEVDTMSINEKFRQGQSEEMKCRILELPYKGKELSMIILLPDRIDGLSAIEKALTPAFLHKLPSLLSFPEKVDVKMPKFKLETSFDLEKALAFIGMKDLFVANIADLSGIDDSKQLYVSNVIHKAFVEVNEEGTEAAAATAAIMMLSCAMPMRPTEFIVDHPFMFFIYDKRSGTYLFAGRLINPEAAKK